MSPPVTDLVASLERFGSAPPADARPGMLVVDASDDPARVAEHRHLRIEAFVHAQGLFPTDDLDEHDSSPDTRVLVAVGTGGEVLGGVRLHPAGEQGRAIGWWQGSRLVCRRRSGIERRRVGTALVRAACAMAVTEGALRFDAQVQSVQRGFFERLGWEAVRPMTVRGVNHWLMRFPVDTIAALARETKGLIGSTVGPAVPAGAFRGDDGAPVPGTEMVACSDAILPSMVERDPEWAGWCGMLVTAHDLAAMGASPLGALDTLAAPDVATAERVVAGLRAGAERLDLPLLGGHTQLGVHAALSVTGLGSTDRPVPGGGGRPGQELTVTADLDGGWRPGYRGRQWDSSSGRTREELRAMLDAVALVRPAAAKDVSMAGIAGTAGMLAEASGCGAELDVAAIPRPDGVTGGDWLTCFPGFAMVTADDAGAAPLPAGPATGAACGRLTAARGVRLRWPDGEVTEALSGGVTGLGAAA